MKKIKIAKRGGEFELMSLDVFARWGALIEAFEFIEQKADERGVKDMDSLLKPVAIEKYIDERYPSIRHDVEAEYNLGLI